MGVVAEGEEVGVCGKSCSEASGMRVMWKTVKQLFDPGIVFLLKGYWVWLGLGSFLGLVDQIW